MYKKKENKVEHLTDLNIFLDLPQDLLDSSVWLLKDLRAIRQLTEESPVDGRLIGLMLLDAYLVTRAL